MPSWPRNFTPSTRDIDAHRLGFTLGSHTLHPLDSARKYYTRFNNSVALLGYRSFIRYFIGDV